MARNALSDFDDVVEALGGLVGLAMLTGHGVTAVSNWRSRGRKFPARHYLRITDALARKKLSCSRELFNFRLTRRTKPKRAAA